MRVAIIDMGTNTFNLLVVEFDASTTTRLFSAKKAVKLGEGGFAEKRIQEEAFKRGIYAIGEFMNTTKELACDQVYAFATSAIRSASNGPLFTESILKNYNLQVDVISGMREAELIYKGVKACGVLSSETVLIMDIGGGSTEFIIANQDHIFWKHSFVLGAARLLELFTPSDPISMEQVSEITNYLVDNLTDLFQALRDYPCTKLIGSSGSFDSIVDILHFEENKPLRSELEIHNPIELEEFDSVYKRLLTSTRLERYNEMPGLISMRADFIVISTLFINTILKNTTTKSIMQSAYSLKEGVMEELRKQNTNG